jgi:epsin
MPLFKAISSVKDKLTLTPNELLIKEVTSNDDSLVSTNSLHSVAELTFQPMDYPKVMEAVWGSLRAPRQEWRRIQRSLLLSDILMKFGSSRCVQELRDYLDRFRPLQEFRYTDEDIERGAIIREKSRYLVEILSDFTKIEQEREIAKKQKNKCVGMSRDDVYRGNYKKNTSYEDVKGYFNYEMGKNPPAPLKETREEPKEEKKVMNVSTSQQNFQERPKPPSFEPATVPQPVYNQSPTITAPNFVPAQVVQPSPAVLMTGGNGGITGNSYQSANTGYPQHNNPNYTGYYSTGHINQPGFVQTGLNAGVPQGTPQYGNYGPGIVQGGPYNPGLPQTNPYNNPGYPQSNPNFPSHNVGYPPSNAPYAPSTPVYTGTNAYPSSNYPVNIPPSSLYQGPGTPTAAKSNIKHNLPSMQAQVEPAKPPPKSVDLESLLMNLDGLQPNSKLK